MWYESNTIYLSYMASEPPPPQITSRVCSTTSHGDLQLYSDDHQPDAYLREACVKQSHPMERASTRHATWSAAHRVS
jgi:hypothetical protein